jgi:hypothetical protein
MHYSNGREAKDGDFVIGKAYTGSGPQVVAGVITKLNPGCQTCNGLLVIPVFGGTQVHSATIGELMHAEDAFAASEDLKAREDLDHPKADGLPEGMTRA